MLSSEDCADFVIIEFKLEPEPLAVIQVVRN